MRALITNRTDRVMLAITAFSGVMFLACIGLMATNYKPLLGEEAIAQDLNAQVYSELKANFVLVQSQMSSLPAQVGESFGAFSTSKAMVPTFDLAAPLQGLISAGRSFINSEN